MSDPWPGDAPAPTGPGVNAARFPLGRGAPADVAPMALLLASAGGAYITGQTLSIDGGFAIA
jgi:NAD(P)-dependent dehydrogenase (short-subunit alcohol dehydrogenase family)